MTESLEQDSSADSAASWTVLCLLAGISFLWFVGNFLADFVSIRVQKLGYPGLSRFYRQVQGELLTIGIVTVILVAVQGLLSSSCVLATAPPSSPSPDVSSTSESHVYTAFAVVPSLCSTTATTLNVALLQTILLFPVVSLVHVVFAGSVGALAVFKAKQWRRWEEQGEENVVTPMHSSVLKAMHRNPWANTTSMLALTLFRPLHKERLEPAYLGIRCMFMERMTYLDRDWQEDFLFNDYMLSSVGDALSVLIRVNWLIPITMSFFLLGIVNRQNGLQILLIAISNGSTILLLVFATSVTIAVVKLGGVCNVLYTGSKDGGGLMPGSRNTSRASREVLLPLQWQRSDGNSEASIAAALVVERMDECRIYMQDPSQVFWFGQPKVLLRCLQVAYFLGSLGWVALSCYVWNFGMLPTVQPSWATLGSAVASYLALLAVAWHSLPLYCLACMVDKAALAQARLFAVEQEEHAKLEELRLSNARQLGLSSEPVKALATTPRLPPANQWQVRTVSAGDMTAFAPLERHLKGVEPSTDV